MSSRDRHEIVPGVSMDPSGHVSVDKLAGEVLFDLAIELEDVVSDPVDIEHVLAAIVLAARSGQIDSSTPLNPENIELMATLRSQLRVLFDQYGDEIKGFDSPDG